MLYLLLYPLHKYYSGFNALRYETLRSVLAGLAALALSLALGPILIDRFRELHIGQTIREVVPQAHQKKAGTPTMGGLLIRRVDAGGDPAARQHPQSVRLDRDLRDLDLRRDRFHRRLPQAHPRERAGSERPQSSSPGQFSCAFIAAAWLFPYLGFDTHLTVPFLKNIHPDLHWWLYIPFAMLVIVGCSHAVNLTDGLDGLAIGPVMTVALTYWTFTYVAGNIKFATYLQIPYIANVGEVAIFCASMIAASLGFLWFNAYPASMMMGDVGALALGGALGTVAVLAKQELALAIAGGVFVAEALSTIIQRYYFKATHKRFFLMAPLHHHFELKGMARNRGRHHDSGLYRSCARWSR